MTDELQQRIRENLVQLDSYLSLLYYRNLVQKNLDSQDKHDIENAIHESRQLQKLLKASNG